ncbi:hypothetical protein LINPERHAP1_LOCUS21876 [Linum perenne]
MISITPINFLNTTNIFNSSNSSYSDRLRGIIPKYSSSFKVKATTGSNRDINDIVLDINTVKVMAEAASVIDDSEPTNNQPITPWSISVAR